MNSNRIQTKEKSSGSIFSSITNGLLFPFMLLTLSLSCWTCEAEKAATKTAPIAQKSEAAAEETKTKTDKKVVLFYGDSLTAGYGLEEDQSFPSRIEDKIDSLGLNYTVVNAGLSGETTSGGLKRIDWVLKQKVDIFFLELGANDMLRGLPLDETRKNLSEIIAKVKAKNAKVKIGLCEMIAAPNMGDDYVKAFNKIFHDLAAEHSITFVPFFLEGVAGYRENLLRDGKHPNAKGQIIAADNIWKTLEGML